MNTIQVAFPSEEWQELVGLSQQEQVSPMYLLLQAVRRFLEERNRLARARQSLQDSFGIWKDRDDLDADSMILVQKLRQEWDIHERHLELV